MVGRLGIARLGAVLARAGKAAGSQAGSGGAAGIGAIAGIVLLLPMEAGVPVPIPADLALLAGRPAELRAVTVDSQAPGPVLEQG